MASFDEVVDRTRALGSCEKLWLAESAKRKLSERSFEKVWRHVANVPMDEGVQYWTDPSKSTYASQSRAAGE